MEQKKIDNKSWLLLIRLLLQVKLELTKTKMYLANYKTFKK